MAAVSDCFSLGSTVWCKTCNQREIEGEVLAFDPQSKVLILKCPGNNGLRHMNDVHLINLQLVSELRVKKEVNIIPDVPQSLNLNRLNTRIRNQVEERRTQLEAISANVSPEGQNLFLTIAKTIKEVRWSSSDIVVFENQIIISPPYQVENIKGNLESDAYVYIRKVVEKFIKDRALSPAGVNSQMIQHNTPAQ